MRYFVILGCILTSLLLVSLTYFGEWLPFNNKNSEGPTLFPGTRNYFQIPPEYKLKTRTEHGIVIYQKAPNLYFVCEESLAEKPFEEVDYNNWLSENNVIADSSLSISPDSSLSGKYFEGTSNNGQFKEFVLFLAGEETNSITSGKCPAENEKAISTLRDVFSSFRHDNSLSKNFLTFSTFKLDLDGYSVNHHWNNITRYTPNGTLDTGEDIADLKVPSITLTIFPTSINLTANRISQNMAKGGKIEVLETKTYEENSEAHTESVYRLNGNSPSPKLLVVHIINTEDGLSYIFTAESKFSQEQITSFQKTASSLKVIR